MLAIYSELSIGAQDRAFIDCVRRAHDPQEDFITPHFTFVFPFSGVAISDVQRHTWKIAAETPPIDFCLTGVAAVPDPLVARSHVFLIPSDGVSEIQALHSRLHSGVLASKKHPTIEHEPLVTIAAFERHKDAECLAATIPAVHIPGTLTELVLGQLEDRRILVRQRFTLAG